MLRRPVAAHPLHVCVCELTSLRPYEIGLWTPDLSRVCLVELIIWIRRIEDELRTRNDDKMSAT